MEENQQNYTVWQRLSKAFGPNSLLNQDYPTYKLDKEVLLKTDDKAEYEKQKLQAQQTMYLAGQWAKIENNLYTQAVYYEPTRLASFYDFESMEFSIAGDTKIATPDGFITIKELADKGRDYEFITYAYDHNLKKVVPAKARNAHYTRDEMTYKITFDDDSFIIATHGHRFLKRDGVFCVVEDLKEGDSMMPFYRKSFYNNQNYNWIYSCNSKEGHHGWVTEHDLIAEWYNETKIQDDEEVHHIDFNGKNNMPENLQIMKINEHRAYHARLNNERLWANPEYRKKMTEVGRRTGKMSWGGRRSGTTNPSYIQVEFDDIVSTAKEQRTLRKTAETLGVSIKKIKNELRFNGFKHWFDFLDMYKIPKYVPQTEDRESLNFNHIPWDLIIATAQKHKTSAATAKELNISLSKLTSSLRMGGYKTWRTFMNAYGFECGTAGRKKQTTDEKIVNHKIKSIEPYGVIPVYDLTVPGYKNFATDTIFSHNTPEISAALDIYAEESTTSDQNGHMLQIYSESKRIRNILADLFNNALDLNTNLPMWIRNVCKFGDDFVYLKLDPEKGVVGCMQLPNIEIERLERGMAAKSMNAEIDPKQKGLRFNWKTKDIEFNAWEVAHFRLLGDDRKLPYGTSMLEKARRIWKQLCVSENTEVWTEMGYKKIKDLTPGEIIYSYDYDNNKLIPTPIKDCWQSGIKKTYNIRTRYNSIDVTDDHQVLVYNNGEFIYKTISDIKPSRDRVVTPTIDSKLITKTIKLGGDDYYIKLNELGLEKANNLNRVGIVKKLKAIDEKNYKNIHRFIQGNGKIEYKHINSLCGHLGFTKSDFDLYYNNTKSIVNIDLEYTIDESFIRFFGFMLGDGWLCKNGIGFALGVDDELNNFYIDYVKKHLKENTQHTKGKHSEYSRSIIVSNKEIKNIFTNLGFITGFANKRIPTWIYGMGASFKRALIKGLFDADGSDKYGVIGLANKGLITDLKQLTLQSGIACGKIGEKDGGTRFNEKTGKYETRQDSYKLYINFNNIVDDVRYEKIIDITENEPEAVWDLEVESELHNFIANGSVVHNCLAEDAMLIYRTSRAPERRVFKVFVGNMDDKDVEPYVQRVANKFKRDQVVDSKTGNVDLRFNQMAVDQDYFIPVRDPAATMPIETLAGAQNLSEIADIEYIQKKLVTALRIPKAYLGFEEALGDGKNLSLLDIRFARTINKIQKSVLGELNKIAIIHLFLLGFEDELSNFTLGLTNPSKQADLLMVEVWKEKVALYKELVNEVPKSLQPTSATWAKKHIFGFSDDEIKLDVQQIRLERAISAELDNTATIITRTGIFDTVDKLYKTTSGSTETPPPTGGDTDMSADMGAPPMDMPPPPPGGETLPENKMNDNLNLLLENDDILGDSYLDLGKARNSLGSIEKELAKILKD